MVSHHQRSGEASVSLYLSVAVIDPTDHPSSPRAESPTVRATPTRSPAVPSRSALSGSRRSHSPPADQAAVSTAPLPIAPPAATSHGAAIAPASARTRNP